MVAEAWECVHMASHNNTMQQTIISVTPFAFAKAAPLKIAADRERYAVA